MRYTNRMVRGFTFVVYSMCRLTALLMNVKGRLLMSKFILITLLAFIVGIIPTAMFGFPISNINWWLIVVPSDVIMVTLVTGAFNTLGDDHGNMW